MRRKFSVLLCILFIMYCTLFPMQIGAQSRIIPILMYHNVDNYNPDAPYDMTVNIPASTFELHMHALLNAGYTPITYEMYYAHETQGAALPEKPILITFDDGYLSNYLYAYPILKKLNIKATMFVITDRRGKALSINPHFSWNQAREMVDSGIIDIYSHTHSHQVSTTLSDERLAYELSVSKRLIEQHTGKKCNVLAFPNGIAGEREIAAAKHAGYKIVNLVGNYGVNRTGDDLTRLKRINVDAHWTTYNLLQNLELHSAL